MRFFGGLDTLIINHANLGYTKMWFGTQENLDMFDNMLDVNVSSYVHLASHALPYLMKSEQGRMGIMGSIAGIVFICIYPLISVTYQNKDYLLLK